MQVVLINGEKQSGKSTFANHLANLLVENGIHAEVKSLVKPYEVALIAMMNHNYGYNPEVNGWSYQDAKKAPVYPGASHTGRDWMIQQGDAARALDKHMLPAIAAATIDAAMQDVLIIENWGFQDEWEYFVLDKAAPFFETERLITISLTARSTRRYQSGEQYDGDNRFNLDAMAKYVDPKVNVIAQVIDPNHDYRVDTIGLQFAAEISEPIESDVMMEDDSEVSEFPFPASEQEDVPSVGVEPEGDAEPTEPAEPTNT